jgi:hypothetical protein
VSSKKPTFPKDTDINLRDEVAGEGKSVKIKSGEFSPIKMNFY